jgi:hypothetical protein
MNFMPDEEVMGNKFKPGYKSVRDIDDVDDDDKKDPIDIDKKLC